MLVSSQEAVQLLKSNRVVAVPTETVYGLAGRISSPEALKLIFETKKRPFFDPLIVHVKDKAQAKSLTTEWSEVAESLANRFWPGPLTLVIRKNHLVSDLITSGLERVGLRCPRHPLALEILENLGEPFAAPSANLFGRTSPTSAGHVESEFQNQVPTVDGGSCDIGIESTVLLVDANRIAVLRKGQVQAQEIESELTKTQIKFEWIPSVSKAVSPGHMQHHYMPRKPLFWVEAKSTPNSTELVKLLNQKLKELPSEVEGVKLVIPKSIQTFAKLDLSIDASQAARALYSELRRLAEGPEDCLVFFAEEHHNSTSWEAVIERLKKASSSLIHI